MTVYFSNWPRVLVVEPWSRLKTFNAGFKNTDAILVSDATGPVPVAEHSSAVSLVPPGSIERPAPPEFAERFWEVRS
jgi:hypothetical protein